MNAENLSELENIKIYNGIIQSLTNTMNQLIKLPDKGNLWPIVAANNFVIIGLEAALGHLSISRTVVYFCDLTPNVSIW